MSKPRIYIDCGFFVGDAMRKYIDAGIIDNTWKIYAFEANPVLDHEHNSERIIQDFYGNMDITLLKKAVWIEDGQVPFIVGKGRTDAASVEGTTPHGEPTKYIVDSVDFSNFLSELPEAYILCSMDIEGSEYPVLEKLLTDTTINRINLLDIEFHHRLIAPYTSEKSQELINKILEKGVGMRLKVGLHG